MPDYRRARIKGATYFFTVVTYRRQPVLCLPESLDAMKDVMSNVAERYPFHTDAWVVLPDHMHCLWIMPRVGAKHLSPLLHEMGRGEEGLD
jgi:putative transposase